MPNTDGKGPRQQSPKPSKPRGGNKLGNCKPTNSPKTGKK